MQERHGESDQPPANLFLKGLRNGGRSSHRCFLNALLQLLASSARLNDPDTIAELRKLRPLGEALCDIFDMLNTVNTTSSERDAVDAGNIVCHLARVKSHFSESMPQDSHEALLVMIERLQKEQALKVKRLAQPVCSQPMQLCTDCYRCK